MKLEEIYSLDRDDQLAVMDAIDWIEPALRPPPRERADVWRHLFVKFENTDVLCDGATNAVAHHLCNFLVVKHAEWRAIAGGGMAQSM